MAEKTWLYTRRLHSVRVSRVNGPNGCLQLLIYGPRSEMSRFGFADVTECMKRQADIEGLLVALGYQLAPSSERRSGDGICCGDDERRDRHEGPWERLPIH
jgi:hypothetical protein